MVMVPLPLSYPNSLNRILDVSSHPIWYSCCLKWLAKSLPPALWNLQSHLLSGSRDTSSYQRIGARALDGAEFWGVIFTHLSQIQRNSGIFRLSCNSQISISVSYSTVPEKCCPEVWPKITIELAHPFPRACFSLPFLGHFGEFSQSFVCFLAVRRLGILIGLDFSQTGLWWWSAWPCWYMFYMLWVTSLHFSPWLPLAFFSGFDNLRRKSPSRHSKETFKRPCPSS